MLRFKTELENEVSSNEETIDNLDKQLSDSKFNLCESESKEPSINTDRLEEIWLVNCKLQIAL